MTDVRIAHFGILGIPKSIIRQGQFSFGDLSYIATNVSGGYGSKPFGVGTIEFVLDNLLGEGYNIVYGIGELSGINPSSELGRGISYGDSWRAWFVSYFSGA